MRDRSTGRQERSRPERIIHGVNRHTALECNRIRGAEGAFWQHESYDHWVRDADELERIIDYMEGNLQESREQGFSAGGGRVALFLGICSENNGPRIRPPETTSLF